MEYVHLGLQSRMGQYNTAVAKQQEEVEDDNPHNLDEYCKFMKLFVYLYSRTYSFDEV